ncbi:hypothetical protein FOZ63_008391, partial [Perkinsus olseni]
SSPSLRAPQNGGVLCPLSPGAQHFGYIQVSQYNKYVSFARLWQQRPLLPQVARYSWTEDANSIWVDAPGPTGFSQGPMEPNLAAVVNLANSLIVLFKDYSNLGRDLHLVGTSAS